MMINQLVWILLVSWLIAFTTCQESCSPYDEAMIPDCNCKSQSVEQAVVQVLTPLLKNITESTYFRYFFVDLEKPCPFWQEDGMCMMEACSVCTCEESEIPKSWLEENASHAPINSVSTSITGGKSDKPTSSVSASSSAYGWVTEQGGPNKDASLSRVTVHASADTNNIGDTTLGDISLDTKSKHSSDNNIHDNSNNNSYNNNHHNNPLDPSAVSTANNGYNDTTAAGVAINSDSDSDIVIGTSSGRGLGTALSQEMNRLQRSSAGYLRHLHATEDCDTLQSDDWTTVEEAENGRSLAEVGVYVNLLQNPERYTGYSGPSAQRVWTAIAEENCFSSPSSLTSTSSSTATSNAYTVANNAAGNNAYDGAGTPHTQESTRSGNAELSHALDSAITATSAATTYNVNNHNMEQCLETRVFHRLIAGLRSSITVHIAREYRFRDILGHESWAAHPQLFLDHIAAYPDRLQNLYFTFLFVLRAVTKAEEAILNYTLYDTGDSVGDERLKQQLHALYQYLRSANTHITDTDAVSNSALAECARAFNETLLFQQQPQRPTAAAASSRYANIDTSVNTNNTVITYASSTNANTNNNHNHNHYYKQYADVAGSAQSLLREEFRQKFRNISRILDCVTCEKCRLWGKLQILGLGTAAKILLSSPTDSAASASALRLRRQEVIALVNTLHQLTKSVAFAAHTLSSHKVAASTSTNTNTNTNKNENSNKFDNNVNNKYSINANGDSSGSIEQLLLCELSPLSGSLKGALFTLFVAVVGVVGLLQGTVYGKTLKRLFWQRNNSNNNEYISNKNSKKKRKDGQLQALLANDDDDGDSDDDMGEEQQQKEQ